MGQRILYFIYLLYSAYSQDDAIITFQSMFAPTNFYTPSAREINETKTTVNALGTEIRDIGECDCDFQQSVCEYKCCCDLDCDATTTSFWIDNDQCQSKSLSQRCVKEYLITKINLKRGMRVFSKKDQRQLCIQSDQQNTFSEFFQERSMIPYETIVDYYKNISVSIGITLPQQGDLLKSQLTPYKGYQMKQTIGGTQANFNVFYPDNFGQCGNLKTVKFLSQIDKVQCSVLFNMGKDCKIRGKLDSNYFFEPNLELYVDKDYKTTISFGNTGKLYLIFSQKLLRYFLKKTGDTEYTNIAAPVAISLIDNGDGTCSCMNTIDGIRYLFVYDEKSFKLTSMVAQVYMRDITQSSCTGLGTSSFFSEVNFINSQGTFFDGNPGYKQGNKVYGGRKIDTSMAFDNLGLVINTGYDPLGICLTGPSTFADTTLLDPLTVDYLKFGQGLSYSCVQKWTKTQIQENCNQKFLDSLKLFNNFPYKPQYVYLSRTAYANRLFQQEWIDLQLLPHQLNITFDSKTSTCKLPVQYNILIFYSKMGQKIDQQYIFLRNIKNRQLHIVDGHIGYSDYQSLALPASASLIDTLPVHFTLNIKFYNLEEGDIENSMPPNPSFIPQLPDDFFFPVWYESISTILTLGQVLVFSLALIQ